MATSWQLSMDDGLFAEHETRVASKHVQRLIYSSRLTCAAGARGSELQRIVERAHEFNAEHGMSGLLMSSQDRLLQVLHGPPADVAKLLQKLRADKRHTGFDLLAWHKVESAAFGNWPMGLVERNEPATSLDARLAWLKTRLAGGFVMPARDLAQFMIAPNPGTAAPSTPVGDVLLVSPGGLWGPSVLQRAAVRESSYIARSTLWHQPQQSRRAVVEFVDIAVGQCGTARVLSVTGDWPSPSLLATALDRLAVVVLMISPSDLANPRDSIHWLHQLVPAVGQPFELLVVSNCERERLSDMMAAVPAPAKVSFMPLRLSRSDEIWQAVMARVEESVVSVVAQQALAAAAQAAPAAVPGAVPVAAATDLWLKQAQRLVSLVFGEAGVDGVCAAAVAALESTRIFQPTDMPCKDDADLPGLAQFVRDQFRLLEKVSSGECLAETTLITSRHLLVATILPSTLTSVPSCLLLILDRNETTLAAARLQLAQRLESLPAVVDSQPEH